MQLKNSRSGGLIKAIHLRKRCNIVCIAHHIDISRMIYTRQQHYALNWNLKEKSLCPYDDLIHGNKNEKFQMLNSCRGTKYISNIDGHQD